MPWRLVEDRATILGRDGREASVWPLERAESMLRVAWQDASGQRGEHWVELEAVVPVVLPDMGRALATLFERFPGAQILQITDM